MQLYGTQATLSLPIVGAATRELVQPAFRVLHQEKAFDPESHRAGAPAG